MELELKAYAKINLGLDVLRKRKDGYHDVKMVMQTVDLYDVLKISEFDEDEIELESSLQILPVNEDNIVYRACKLIKDEYDIKKGVKIYIDKHIPIAAGLAGGSADAAAALIGLNRMFDLNIPKEQLMEYGVSLGADVPFCIMRGTALSEGIGEKLTRLSPLPDCYILIAKPAVNVSTRKVYQSLRLDEISYHPNIDKLVKSLDKQDLKEITVSQGNLLETVTIPMHEEIMDLKVLIRRCGAVNPIMSGSGPTVFGIFEDEDMANEAARIVKDENFANQVFVVKPVNVND